MRGSGVGKRAAILFGLWALAATCRDGAQADLKPTEAVADVRGAGRCRPGPPTRSSTRGGDARGGRRRRRRRADPAGDDVPMDPGRGAAVAIDDTTGAKIRFTVPIDAKRLAFLATVADGRGSRDARVTVPISTPPPPPPRRRCRRPADRGRCPPRRRSRPVRASGAAVADAGDDQIGLVGRRITLNGLAEPAAEPGRVPLDAPLRAGDLRAAAGGAVFLVRAHGAGGLSVRAAGRAREQGVDAERRGGRGRPAAAARRRARRRRRGVAAAGAVGAAAVATIPGGERDGVAGRRRLRGDRGPGRAVHVVLAAPERADAAARRGRAARPATRSLWSSQVFVPLSQITASELMAAGIDLRVPSASDRPLEAAQKETDRSVLPEPRRRLPAADGQTLTTRRRVAPWRIGT